MELILLFNNPMEIVPTRIDFTVRLLSNSSEFHKKILQQESELRSFVKVASDFGPGFRCRGRGLRWIWRSCCCSLQMGVLNMKGETVDF